MEYQDSDPENAKYIEEIHRRNSFNNLQDHIPNGFYRNLYKSQKLIEEHKPLWDSIDKFIEENDFDVDAYHISVKKEYTGEVERNKSDLMLCKMYVYLRKEGFDETSICI